MSDRAAIDPLNASWLRSDYAPIVLVAIGISICIFGIFILFYNKSRSRPENNKKNELQKSKKPILRSTKSNRLGRYASLLEPKSQKEFVSLELKLTQAGYTSGDAVRFFHLAQYCSGLACLLAGTLYLISAYNDVISHLNPRLFSLGIILPGSIGYALPKYWVLRRQRRNRQKLIEGFPDALDLLLICVEAGQSIDQAIMRVSRELQIWYPKLADEFYRVSLALKAGQDRTSVLREMARRTGVPEISSFVTVLIQSANFGTSVSDALRVFASEMRDKRIMRAEELANTLPTKMTLATMILTVPPLLLILVGPSILEIYNTLTNSDL